MVVMISIGATAGSPDSVSSASSQDNSINTEIIFKIPVGDEGIHYEGADNPDVLTWGPPAFTVAPDGTYWIADTPDDHLLRFSQEGKLLDKIFIGDFVTGAGDLEVTSSGIWVLDVASIPPKVVQLNHNGKIISLHHLPKGLWLEDGLSGISIGSDGSLIVECIGGHAITQLITSGGEIKLEELEGYEFQGKVYSAYPADMREKDTSEGYILAGDKRIDVAVTNDLGGLSILHINSDGSFYAKVVELVLHNTFQVDQKVYHYNATGTLIGMARVPLAERYTSVEHGLAVGPDGEVYALITKPDSGEIRRLEFNANLLPILPQIAIDDSESTGDAVTSEPCLRTRAEIISVANEYLNNSTFLSSYHINNNSAYSGRVKPSYLGNAGYYSSVPYSWNLWDTVAQFNNFMNGDNNNYFAGNASTTYYSCGRGIDCSGLVSRAWNLSSHYGTCTLDDADVSRSLSSPYVLKPGDIMNLCGEYSGHVIIFGEFFEDGMKGYEATMYNHIDRVAYIYRPFDTIDEYTPREYKRVCNTIHLPLINKTEMYLDSKIALSDPYPPPEDSQSPAPLLPPYPYP